ncbi:hypothetical protein Mp_zg00160 [Marchantia polymorpha subsp. ruderalis]|uniref:chitinase n=1 Tax=Marchantia polymorpha subsp. ruderalis TaxID=1480154 RepID=A0A679E0P8_MARPO|nr:hypothetical protein Mp_zg00160 [Marchantia polymorpha subsp. ruderalis]
MKRWTWIAFLVVLVLPSVLARNAFSGPDGTCSAADPCPNNLCCSEYGYCGSEDTYCCAGCQDNCHCSTPVPPSAPPPPPAPPLPPGAKCSTAAYWGQNGNEGTLREACSSGRYGIVLISFLTHFGYNGDHRLNLAGHCPDIDGSGCKQLESENVKVLLSLGGSGDAYYGFNTLAEAEYTADYLWNNFFGGSSSSSPFGKVALDGIDLDIESGGSSYYPDLIRKLLAVSEENNYGKKVYITAAPQCPKPDNYLGPNGEKTALGTGLVDYVFVQFYNNYCDYRDLPTMLDVWKQWTSDSALSNAKIFLGLPAAVGAAGSGYVPPEDLLNNVLPQIQVDPRYGGVMLWSVYYDNQNNYSNQISNAICEIEDSTVQTLATE